MKAENSGVGEPVVRPAVSDTVLVLKSVHVSLGPAAQVEALREITLSIHAGDFDISSKGQPTDLPFNPLMHPRKQRSAKTDGKLSC